MPLLSLFVAATLSGSTADQPTTIAGVWSLGETPNCQSGTAWVFVADGYYVEVKLPDKGPNATGIWKDEGDAIAYTHDHMPYEGLENKKEPKRLTIIKRSANHPICDIGPRPC